MYFNSRYNFKVPLGKKVALYNTLTGNLISFSGADGMELASLLCGRKINLNIDHLPEAVANQLIKGGFLTQRPDQELKTIDRRFQEAREECPVVITITTTMDCNLGCYYCYESRTKNQLETSHVSEILELARESLKRKNKKSLHIDWYGGEPLLNLAFLEKASEALQKLCSDLGVSYHASVISNGTLWPENLETFIKDHKIRQVQISLDGLKKNHDKRRRYRKGYKPEKEASSFNKAIELIDKLLHFTQVDVRLNFDRKNLMDMQGLLDLAENRGWFSKPYPAVIQPARLSAYTEESDFMRSYELNIEEFETIRKTIREQVPGCVKVEESEIPDGFPYPKTSVCAALALDSFVVGGEAKLYRCGLQVGEEHRSTGSLNTNKVPYPNTIMKENAISQKEKTWWESFNPTALESCSKCSFLPICWGGCPKEHLEKDQHALDEQSKYFRLNLPRLIAERFGVKGVEIQYSEADQFREGWEN